MTAVLEPLVPGPARDAENIVGGRTLVAVQAVNISRLSTHPVPTVPGTLIVVAGQGPKDSNGAGKSSFIAAITALLGDEQWRFASGARAVAELLFNAELAAQGDSRWASADHGYIVGVFDYAEPNGEDRLEKGADKDPEKAGPEKEGSDAEHEPQDGEADTGEDGDTAVTVWLRVNVDAPHLEIRWRQGVWLASAPSEAGRVALADRLWAGLPRSAGRRDLVAKDLGRVLYGGQVRCVSFLSTSVRSKVATNLLSQPLNEIGPERIFSAIAALTGLDRELEAERRSRAEEHRERAKAVEAAERLAGWEREAAALLKTFDRRDRARDEVAAALRHWRTRQARLLVDAADADAAHAAAQERLRAEGEELAAAAKAADREIEQLTGGALDARVGEADAALADLKGQADELGADKAVARNRLDELRRRVSALEERRREADGRDGETARAELAHAEARRDEAQQEFGMARGAVARAERSLAEAEAGESSAPAQLRALAAAGIGAVGLLDAVELAEDVRERWEAALWPYREAVVVATADLDAAAGALKDLPGSMIVPADDAPAGDAPGPAGAKPANAEPASAGRAAEVPADTGPADDALAGDAPADAVTAGNASVGDIRARAHPRGVRCDLPLGGFFASLENEGVVIIGGFPEPVTGKVARVQAARAALETANEALETARRATSDAAADVALAGRRLAGARAAAELDDVRGRMAELRERLEELAGSESRLGPRLGSAEQTLRRLQAKADTRALEVDRLRGRKEAHERERDRLRRAASELADKRAALGLDGLEKDWGGSREGAAERLSGLDDDEATWTPAEWWHTAEKHLSEALRRVFPDGPSDEDMPEEMRFLLRERAEGEGRRTDREQATFPRLVKAVEGYLRQQEDYERHQRRQIEVQLSGRRADLGKAQTGAREAAGAAEAHRTALTAAIRARLQRVSEEFEKLDVAYGGYGATLEFPTPEQPGDPEQEWRWRVTPKWRRSEGQRHVPYNRRANTALMDEKAVKLVCAAALASSGGGRLCLVLDELGRNLGKEHRKEAVALFRKIGETHGITVIGALQDDMEPYAIDACGQYVKLRRSSDTMPYNEPPVVVGHDEHEPRVRRLAALITAARPAPDEGTMGESPETV
ncbi:chromosome partitioning protein ParA [Actinomadura graeca]|uniref:Chromosome partitioning protein ParA n=1 Tax=Actinomadura graeca TaxID=2750812 RepID=A0ABX8QP36_9ACTN|nr:chromosome partitioning protein ParA [Actinomadura graeca]QXJ20477.1 chromosome partitioning protein ParA [Actinomadura graeca]